MGNKEKTPITIDDVEYKYEDLTPQQQRLFNHCIDLDRKIDSSQFNLEQLMLGKERALQVLKEALETKPQEITEQ
jgi:hypothetical protein